MAWRGLLPRRGGWDRSADRRHVDADRAFGADGAHLLVEEYVEIDESAVGRGDAGVTSGEEQQVVHEMLHLDRVVQDGTEGRFAVTGRVGEIDLDRRREPPPGPEPQPEPRTPPEPQPGNNPE